MISSKHTRNDSCAVRIHDGTFRFGSGRITGTTLVRAIISRSRKDLLDTDEANEAAVRFQNVAFGGLDIIGLGVWHVFACETKNTQSFFGKFVHPLENIRDPFFSQFNALVAQTDE